MSFNNENEEPKEKFMVQRLNSFKKDIWIFTEI